MTIDGGYEKGEDFFSAHASSSLVGLHFLLAEVLREGVIPSQFGLVCVVAGAVAADCACKTFSGISNVPAFFEAQS